MANKDNKTNTTNSSKSSIWDKPAKVGKWVGKNVIKGSIPLAANWALDRMNKTSSLYYDPKTGTYIETADMQPIWQKNAVKDSNWFSQGTHYLFNDVPKLTGEAISDIAEVTDPATRDMISAGTNLASYAIPYYGVGKGIYDIESKVVNNVLDTNRDIDMIKDLRYGDLGFSIKYLENNEYAPLWEGIKTSLANDYMASVADFWGDTLGIEGLKGSVRRTSFSPQSDVYKLGQQTTIKMMQKMLEDTDNFNPANTNSRAVLNKFNMMNQLLKNSDAYWQFQSIKNSQDMNDDDFYAYLESAGIDKNTYKGMEYAAKQLYNLGDNQERNGLRYDNTIISTQTPMLQYKHARKQNPIQDDPLANLVGGSHMLDGYTRVGNNFIDIKTGENLVPEVDTVNQNTPTQVEDTVSSTTETPVTSTNATAKNMEETTKNAVQDTPNYIKAGFYEFPKEYSRRTGYNFANNPYNIWK